MVDQARAADPRPCRVMIVDDQADTAELLRIVLGRRGFEVATAGSIAAAVAAAEAAPLDVLLSDIDLPDGSGCELLRRLRETRDLPAVALSGHDGDADIRRAREAGFDELLGKPVGIDLLVAVLRRVSGR